MPIFVNVTDPLKPLADFKPESRLAGFSVRQFLIEKGIPEEGRLAIIDGKRVPPEEWDNGLSASARVILTPDVGWAAVIAIVVLIVVAVALYFFLPAAPLDSTEEADSVYTLKGQKNQKRFGQSIERHYGNVRVWPSYMAAPFTKFMGNDQYLYALLCVGLGKYEIENIKIEDSPIGDFDEVEYEIYQPGQRVKLFPTNVQTSTEVGGIELFGPNEDDYDSWVGPFAAASPGSKSYKIQIDISFRQGLYYLSSKSRPKDMTVEGHFQCRKIDADGDPIGSGDWIDLVHGSETQTFEITENSVDVIRRTFSFDVDDGRYEVRGRRTSDHSESIKARDQVHWEGLRTFNHTEQNFGNVTLLAIVAKATNNLNDSSKSAFNCEVTSILPVYDSDAGTWSPEATRNPVWAFCDIVRAQYGKHVGSAFLDMPRLSTLANSFATGNIYFDGTFDTSGTVWSALQTVMNVGKGVPIIRGGLISAVRDSANIVPTLGFSGNNIVRNSMVVNTRIVNHSEHDGIEVKYLDSADWKMKMVSCLIGTDRGISMKQVTLMGCTNRNRAYRWGMYQRAVEIYQTDNISFETGIEGGTAVFGDMIAVKHETIPSENDFVEMSSARLSHDALTYETFGMDSLTVIQLPFIPVFEEGETYRIALRDSIGTVHGPYACTEHPTIPGRVVLEVALDHDAFEVPANAEAAMYWFGISGSEYTLCKVTKIEPGSSEENVKITAVIYDDRIYAFDSATAPAIGEDLIVADLPTLPVVSGVTVKPFPGSREEVVISWKPALGATSYIIYKSLDGVHFRFVDRAFYSGYVLSVDPGTLWVRVRGVNKGAGPFDEWTGTVGIPTTPPDKVANVRLADPFEINLVATWDAEPLADSYIVRVYIGATLIIKKSFVSEYASFAKTYLQSKATAAGATMARDFSMTVQAKNSIGNGAISDSAAFTNPQHPAATALIVGTPTGSNYPVTWDVDLEDDLANFKVYASTTSGFTPGGGNLVTSPTAAAATLAAPVRPLYVRIASLDTWGSEESLSAEFVIP